MNRDLDPRSDESRRIDLAAAEWLVKRDRGLSAQEQDEYLHWLAADPRHGEWIARHQQTWRDFDQLAQWRPEHSVEPNPDLLASRRPARRFALPFLACAAAVAMVFALWPFRAPPGEAERESPRLRIAATDYERRELEDGSIVELNRGTEIDVHFSTGRRDVVLRRGEAHFDVAKDPNRPFRVHAHGVEVRAVGTAFNVKLAPEAFEVVVTEGRVALSRASGDGEALMTRNISDAPATRADELRAPSTPEGWPEIAAGQRAIVPLRASSPVQVAEVTAAEIAQVLSWQPQWLDFSSTPLAQVIAELNRRNTVKILLADAELASLPIVASIRSDNVDGFVRLLSGLAAIEAEQRGPREIVLRRRK